MTSSPEPISYRNEIRATNARLPGWLARLIFRMIAYGLLGIVALSTLVGASIFVYVQVWDPQGSREYSDPFAGLGAFYLIVYLTLAFGACGGAGYAVLTLGRSERRRQQRIQQQQTRSARE